MLDQALELITLAGRDIKHAATMLVPPAWEARSDLDPDVRGFLQYHACLSEPWDGPAGLVFTDGLQVCASLDRNGLRPLRLHQSDDGLVICASEAGAVPLSGRVKRMRLGPGEMVAVDPRVKRLVFDGDIKRRLAASAPYRDWVSGRLRRRSCGSPVSGAPPVEARQVAAGYSREELTVILRPMALQGHEPTSSMGDDTPQPPLARYERPVFAYLKQRFAQVTNPPIDHLRESDVMSLTTRLGRRAALLSEGPQAAGLLEYPSCVLYPDAVERLVREGAAELDATWPVDKGPGGLEEVCRCIAEEASAAVAAGAAVLIIGHRRTGPERVAVPSALAAGAVHHRLLREGLRLETGLVVDCDDARESHHVACLLTNGADAVCPRLALETIAALAAGGRLGKEAGIESGQRNYVAALEDGVLKIISKMGISTLDSYRGAQIIEAIGIGPDVVALCFPGMSSPLGGLSFSHFGKQCIEWHHKAYCNKPALENTGYIKHKPGGEYHALHPGVVESLHEAGGLTGQPSNDMRAAHALRSAVRGNAEAYLRFSELVDSRPPTEPRDLLDIVPAGRPVPLHEVEDAASIARRFSTGAMSHGALSSEAHETIAAALNLIGGRANTGEGGEAPERYRTELNSSIKQVASGRFGVTPEYLAFADEIQIKMAQGSKPGEGGQLPGKKVTVEIARLRHTVPGVALISPPPHHDIYSIEDLAQLVFDLKQTNPGALLSVKLVASEGVGTIAAGVVKALADIVHISGGDGGTGASPLSSIKHAGMPWEVGLAEAQQALTANGLRSRAVLRVDGGLKNGRDVLLAALMGADEYSFGTAVLVAEGCVLVRTCHRNTCPVGIATQDEKLRAKFAATPQKVARYLMFVAEEVRSLLAGNGLRSLQEAVGRTELLRRKPLDCPRAAALDVSSLLPEPGPESKPSGPRSFLRHVPLQRPRSSLGDRLYRDAVGALHDGRQVELRYPIATSDRSVGARLGAAVAAEHGARRPAGCVRAHFDGSAGQSFGAFVADGIELILTGEANDYVAKGMAGGKIVIRPPHDDAGDPVLAGNTALYGATGGRLFIAGRAGERFAVRNSGAVAVVEGAGDHCCEYMTAGAVVVLGPVGRNFGAGMSGGEAYVHDRDEDLEARLNPHLVAAYRPTPAQLESLRRVVLRHLDATGSEVAAKMLAAWESHAGHFKRVAPVAEVARLEALFEGTATSAA